MSVIGRLWRRAPAWRLCGAVAVACTAMTAMFPPALPRWPAGTLRAGDVPGTAAAPSSAGGAARYVPQPDSVPLDYATIEMLPPAPSRTGVIPHAGRMMPLPAGAWQTVAYARGAGVMAAQMTLLDRMEDGVLTGLLLVASPAPVGHVSGPAAAPLACVTPDVLARRLVAGPAGDTYAHECWTIAAADLAEPDGPDGQDALLKAGLGRLETLHVAVPEHMLVVRFVRSDGNGWMLATLFLPDRRATSPGALHRLEGWAGRFETLFHKGYEGTLVAADVTPAAARDPQG